MRWSCALSILVLGWFPQSAEAGDISDALNMAQEIMGPEIVEGLEDFIVEEPEEALSILLHRRGEAYYPSPETARERRGKAPFADLGTVRLGFAALQDTIRRASEATGLPVALIDAVIRTESGYRPHAVSRVGAQGLMQLMPATARSLGVTNAFDPEENILGGARYLRKMYDRFGSLRLAIAAYNAGPKAVKKYDGIPPYRETQRYVATVISRYEAGRARGLQ